MNVKELRLVLCGLLSITSSEGLRTEEHFNYTGLTGFPKGFIFSTATAAYQVEGAWNVSGKGENIWDHLVHSRPSRIANGDTGDVACDSYHKFNEDVENIKYIGFNMYRFSLSWSRLFPTGFTNFTNPDGVRYYNALIDELLEKGIHPMVTLYHWDLPQPLEDIGGWLNPDIASIFAEYARAAFKLFGNKVKWWVTVNEPICVTVGYGSPWTAPGLNLHGTGDYISGHNVIRAHAKAYRIYDKEFRKSQKGKISIVVNGDFSIPKNASDKSHVEAAERANQFLFGWFAHPIFSKDGDYPEIMREYIDNASKPHSSRLPRFTADEIKEIRGSYDYFGLNHYSTKIAEPDEANQFPSPSIIRDQKVVLSIIPGSLQSSCPWLQDVYIGEGRVKWPLPFSNRTSGAAKRKPYETVINNPNSVVRDFKSGGCYVFDVYPDGFRAELNWIKKQYNNPKIFITENGYCDEGDIDDKPRIDYYTKYLKALLAAVKEDGVSIIGYTTWSLIDNFEWDFGYTKKFGIIQVDFNSPNRTRTMKLSAKFFKGLIEINSQISSAPSINTCILITTLIAFFIRTLY